LPSRQGGGGGYAREPTIELDDETRAKILEHVTAALDGIRGPVTHSGCTAQSRTQ
jgi:hypothetical protein